MDPFQAPLEEFVRVRNERVRALRREGKRAEADALARVRRPSRALWAANRLAARKPRAIAGLFDAIEALQRAQHRAIRRSRTTRGAEALKRAIHAEESLLDELAVEAASLAGKDDDDLRRQVREILAAAVRGTEIQRRELREGRLSAEPHLDPLPDLAHIQLTNHELERDAKWRRDQARARRKETRRRLAVAERAKKRAEALEKKMKALQRELDAVRAAANRDR